MWNQSGFGGLAWDQFKFTSSTRDIERKMKEEKHTGVSHTCGDKIGLKE